MDTFDEADAYYQNEYAPEYPQVRLPDDEELQRLLSSSFAGTALHLMTKIRTLKSLRSSGRVLDFGCSWGYGSWQLAQNGYDVTGFELSRPRAAYAREKLGIKTIDKLDALQALPNGSFDIVFSNHVLEHLVNIHEVFEITARLLSPEGLAFHVLPNFTGTTAMRGAWIMWIGEEHPLAPNIEFFSNTLPRHGLSRLQFASSPFDEVLSEQLRDSSRRTRTDGDELLILARH